MYPLHSQVTGRSQSNNEKNTHNSLPYLTVCAPHPLGAGDKVTKTQELCLLDWVFSIFRRRGTLHVLVYLKQTASFGQDIVRAEKVFIYM